MRDAADNRDVRIAGGARILDEKGAAVLMRFDAADKVQPTEADSAEGMTTLKLWEICTPPDFGTRGLGTLRWGMDAPLGTELRRRANVQLGFFLPCLERSAASPRPFEGDWAGDFARLAAVIRQHLDVEHGLAAHRRAVEVVSAARQAYTALVQMASETRIRTSTSTC